MSHPTPPAGHGTLTSKAPAITLGFWLIKICATTVGETGGDAFSMSLNLGYAVSSLIFLAVFAATLTVQMSAKRYHALYYWLVVVATTTVGTTTSDYLDRTLGLGYVMSSILLSLGVIAILLLWRRATGSIAVDRVTSGPNEAFYWLVILVSNTLGTALGDFTADDLGLGFGGGAVAFGSLIALVVLANAATRIPKPILFWAAYVLTRPLGATLGDLMTKPFDHGGLQLGRFGSSAAILALMVSLVVVSEAVRRRHEGARG